MKVMFKRVGFTYVQKENFQLVKTLGFYFVNTRKWISPKQ